MKINIAIPGEYIAANKNEIELILGSDAPRIGKGDTLTLSYNLNLAIDFSVIKKIATLTELSEKFPGQFFDDTDDLDKTMEICRLLQDIRNFLENRDLEEEWTD